MYIVRYIMYLPVQSVQNLVTRPPLQDTLRERPSIFWQKKRDSVACERTILLPLSHTTNTLRPCKRYYRYMYVYSLRVLVFLMETRADGFPKMRFYINTHGRYMRRTDIQVHKYLDTWSPTSAIAEKRIPLFKKTAWNILWIINKEEGSTRHSLSYTAQNVF